MRNDDMFYSMADRGNGQAVQSSVRIEKTALPCLGRTTPNVAVLTASTGRVRLCYNAFTGCSALASHSVPAASAMVTEGELPLTVGAVISAPLIGVFFKEARWLLCSPRDKLPPAVDFGRFMSLL